MYEYAYVRRRRHVVMSFPADVALFGERMFTRSYERGL
jgi:hypothetical protein